MLSEDLERSKAEAIYFSQTTIHVHEEIIYLTRDQAAYNEIFFWMMTLRQRARARVGASSPSAPTHAPTHVPVPIPALAPLVPVVPLAQPESIVVDNSDSEESGSEEDPTDEGE